MSSTEDNFNCVFCKESFDDKETLQVHFRKHGDPQFKKTPASKSTAPEHPQDSDSTAKKIELVSCDVCTEVFPTISKAITHKHKVHPEHDAKYFCCWCGKLFTLKHLYNKHLTSHENASKGSGNIYRCDSCNVDFNVPSAMIYHNKIFHRQDTDLSTIGQSMKQKLVDQELCQLYYCAFCGEEYINKVNLHKHMADDHSDENQSPNEVLRCPLCQAIFYHLDAYEVHLTFHTSEDVYSETDTCKGELSEFTLDSVPPVMEKVEEYEPDKEAESMDIDQLLQLASEGEYTKKHKKHKKHKKSKKNAITLDQFLNMNTDVFGEGLDFQGVEEVPTQAVSKQLKMKVKPKLTSGPKVSKKELDKLKQQGIIIKKKSIKVPVYPGVKVQLGMQNKVQKPLKIPPCSLKPSSNIPKTETQIKKDLPTNEEVLSKLLNQSDSQIKIRKNTGQSVTESESTDKNLKLSDTPESIEVECDLLLRSSEPSSELDPEENVEESKSDKLSVTKNIKESIMGWDKLTDKTQTVKLTNNNNVPDQSGSSKNIDDNIKTTDNKNLGSLNVLKNIQHLTIKQLKRPESNPEPLISKEIEEICRKEITDDDLEAAIPSTKIVNVIAPNNTQPSNARTEDRNEKLTENSSSSIKTDPREKENEAENNNFNTISVKPNAIQVKHNVKMNAGKEAPNLLTNISQEISIKPSTSAISPTKSVQGVQEKECTSNITSNKSKDSLINLGKHITVKSVTQSAITSDKGNKCLNESVTSSKKVVVPQGNIKHFPQITVKSLSNKGTEDCNDSFSDEDFDESCHDSDNNIQFTNSNTGSIKDTKTNNQQQIQHRTQNVTKSLSVFSNNKQITMKSFNQTFTSASLGNKNTAGEDKDFSDNDDDTEIIPKQKKIPITKQTPLVNLLNKNLVIKPVNTYATCASPNINNYLQTHESPNRVDLLHKLNRGITVKTLCQNEKNVTEEPEIFNIDDSDSDETKTPAVSKSSLNPIQANRSNPGPQKINSGSPTSIFNSMQSGQYKRKILHSQQRGKQDKKQETAQQTMQKSSKEPVKSDEDVDNDFCSSRSAEDQQEDLDSDENPEVCQNISKLMNKRNISFKNMQVKAKRTISRNQQPSKQAVKKIQIGRPNSELLKDFHFNESSEEDSTPRDPNGTETTGKELAIRNPEEFMSDDDDDNFEDIDQNQGASFDSQDVINKLKSINANLSIKSNNPSSQHMLNKHVTKSSSHQSNKTVAYTQSQATKRGSSESFAGNSFNRNKTPSTCKQIKLSDEEPNGSKPSFATSQEMSDISTVNQEVTKSVKTIQTKTVVQEITTTVTRTIKTVNQEVAAMSTQVVGNAVTNAPRMQRIVQGMPRTPAQVKNFNNSSTPFRQRAPTNTVQYARTPIRPSGNTAVRSPNNATRLRHPGAQQIRPGSNRPPAVKKLPPIHNTQPQKAQIGKPIKVAPNVLKEQQYSMKRVLEPEGPFSCFKKPNESLYPSGFSDDTTSVASTSQISQSNFSSSTKTIKAGSSITATKFEEQSSRQEFRKLNNLSGLKVVRSSQSTQAVKEVQKIEVSDPKRQSTLEAIQKLQRQGLLMRKPHLEDPDECDQSDSGCEDNDNPNLAIEDGK